MIQHKRRTLMLLDGNAIVHRAYHAIPPLTNDDGVQTNAVYGFTSTLLTVLEKFQPDYIVAAFDVAKKNFRHDLYPEYKAKRKETPEDLVPQFDLVKDVVRSLGIAIVEKDGYEADDVIGTLAAQAAQDDVETVIVTGDKDTLQLVSDHVRVFTMSRGIHDMMLYDAELVKDKMGVTVEQITDYKGLRGDTSDNIPGVKGIGEKTAVELLTTYHDLDHIYAHIDEIKESVRNKLIANKDLAYLSRDLGAIRVDVDVAPIVYDHVRTQAMTFDTARATFHKLGFNSLLKRFPKSDLTDTQDQKDAQKENYVVKRVLEKDVQHIMKSLHDGECAIAWDVSDGTIYGCAIHCDGVVYYLPYKDTAVSVIREIMSDTSVMKTVFDLKAQLHAVATESIDMKGVHADVLLEAYVVQQNKKMDFDALVFDVLGVVVHEKVKGNQMALQLRDDHAESEKICVRAYYTHMLHTHFAEAIVHIVESQKEKANVRTVLETIEMPLVRVLYDMERSGIMVDKERFAQIAHVIDNELDQLSQKIYTEAGEMFNINSTQQLRVILFDKLKISTQDIKKTKTGFSTASDELQKIRDVHPIIAMIERYRELFKLKTTYVDVLPRLADSAGRIHTTFNQAVASTGRLSSSDPNLQNIPIRTEDGRRLREGFIAQEGYKLVSVDYSQIDLRCVAHVSGDPAMIDAFQHNMDIHTYTAAHVLGIEESAVTKDQRRSAKELNFGLIYGMGQFGFARAAGIDAKQAKEFIATYFEKFAGVKKYIDDTKADAAKNGYVETLFGRRRYVKEIQSKNFQLRAAGERMAINMPIQGLAADIMKLAMIAADRYIAKTFSEEDVRAVLQVHDEIIFEVKNEHIEKFGTDIRRIMENVCTLKVPLVVDVAVGERWSDL